MEKSNNLKCTAVTGMWHVRPVGEAAGTRRQKWCMMCLHVSGERYLTGRLVCYCARQQLITDSHHTLTASKGVCRSWAVVSIYVRHPSPRSTSSENGWHVTVTPQIDGAICPPAPVGSGLWPRAARAALATRYVLSKHMSTQSNASYVDIIPQTACVIMPVTGTHYQTGLFWVIFSPHHMMISWSLTSSFEPISSCSMPLGRWPLTREATRITELYKHDKMLLHTATRRCWHTSDKRCVTVWQRADFMMLSGRDWYRYYFQTPRDFIPFI